MGHDRTPRNPQGPALLDRAAPRTRFVPIAMTSLATVIGLIPTARGADANRPLALVVVAGLASSTLFLVPVIVVALARRAQPATQENFRDDPETLRDAD